TLFANGALNWCLLLKNTSSLLSELELELPSWPHLRETTWGDVAIIRTRVEQVKEGTKKPGLKAQA
ncbi:hypothetical protein, partial [Acinetobacter baumannii]|uniref:hypothetical protein n=1 Tax=Acinetobacter baumannii TaxID=470 RepID=UPI001D0CFAC1